MFDLMSECVQLHLQSWFSCWAFSMLQNIKLSSMRTKATEDIVDEGDMAAAAILQARNKFLTQVSLHVFRCYSGAPEARVGQSPILRIWSTPFLFGCHVTERTYASTDCTGMVGETIKRKGGVSQACLGKFTSFILDIHNMVN